MLRDLLKEGGLYTIANLLTKGVSLLLIPFYSDYFTGAEYGTLALLGISGAFATAVFSVQIYQGMSRYISDKETSLLERKQIASTSLFFTISSYLVFILLALMFKEQIIDFLSEDSRISSYVYYLWLITLFLNSLFYTLGVQLKFLRKTKSFSLTSFTYAIFNILLTLFFALGLNYRLESIFLASIFVAPIIIIWQLYLLRKELMFYMGKEALKKLLVFSVPLVPASIAYLALNFTDRVFIKEINQSLTSVGIYDMAFKFSAIISLIVLAFQSAMAPLVYEKYTEKETPGELGKIFKLFIAIGTFGVLCLALFSYETLYIFTQPLYYEASQFMPLFYLSVLLTGLGMFSPGLHVMKKTKLIAVTVIITSLLNIGLNYLLIKEMGIMGAALATLLSVIINNITLFIFSQRLYKIPFDSFKIGRVILIFLIVFFAGSYIDQLITISYHNLLMVKTIIIISFGIFLFKERMLEMSKIKKLFTRKKAIN
jgi:O-antigen/teichoic acid export membrane protein